MSHEISRGNGDIGAKLSYMRYTLAQYTILEDVAMFATTMLHSTIPTDKIALAVIEGDTLKSVTTVGERVIMDLKLDWPSINTRTVKTGQTQLVNDTSLDPDYFPGDGRDAVTMLSELCVPLTHGGETLGTINLECHQAGRFTDDDRRLAEAYAHEIAEAIHRVRAEAPTGKPWELYSVKNRSTMDNYYGILVATYNGETILNRIIHRVVLPWKRGKEMVNNLVTKGYLRREKISAARYAYKITDEGIKAMKTYDGITTKLTPPPPQHTRNHQPKNNKTN
jgi:putative methionine-R-sulfoxide reductase with GAF domain/predicted transcriptional regulator